MYKPCETITFVREIARIKSACLANEKRFQEWELARVSVAGGLSFYRERSFPIKSSFRQRDLDSARAPKNDTDRSQLILVIPHRSTRILEKKTTRCLASSNSRPPAVPVSGRMHFISLIRYATFARRIWLIRAKTSGRSEPRDVPSPHN